jgi:hypothetical protein
MRWYIIEGLSNNDSISEGVVDGKHSKQTWWGRDDVALESGRKKGISKERTLYNM